MWVDWETPVGDWEILEGQCYKHTVEEKGGKKEKESAWVVEKEPLGSNLYRDKWYSCSKILDSLMAWLGEKSKKEFSCTQANQAISESRIFEQEPHFLRYF